MKYADISGLSEKELAKKSKELNEQIFEARMKNALGQLTNPMTIRVMRRDLARYETARTTLRAKAGATTEAKAAPKARKAAAPKKARKTVQTKAGATGGAKG